MRIPPLRQPAKFVQSVSGAFPCLAQGAGFRPRQFVAQPALLRTKLPQHYPNTTGRSVRKTVGTTPNNIAIHASG